MTGNGLFAFGIFDDFTGYHIYELVVFILIGAGGGFVGAYFNFLCMRVTQFRMKNMQISWKRMIELLLITFFFGVISFCVPLMWTPCTPIPVNTADWTSQQVNLLDSLVQYQCGDNEYNQVASLYFVAPDVAMQQLYHYKEVDGTNYTTFDTGALLLFFFPYFFMAALTAGMLCPAGLFVPMLVAGYFIILIYLINNI